MGILNRQSALHLRLLTLLAALLAAAPLEAAPSREYDLKAAFLYHFAAFVDWPPSAFRRAQDPFVVGVFGDDPFGEVLDELLAGERAGDRPMVVRRLTRLDEVQDSQILFICASERARMREILARCAGQPVLTVGDVPGFVELEGMIGFSAEGSRLMLEVNLATVESADLVISSKLLRVARVMNGTQGNQ